MIDLVVGEGKEEQVVGVGSNEDVKPW